MVFFLRSELLDLFCGFLKAYVRELLRDSANIRLALEFYL